MKSTVNKSCFAVHCQAMSSPSLFLDALNGRNHAGRPPVWLMRQAGRYMPSYQAIRRGYSFMEMVRQPKVAADITLLPIDELGVDAAILFSDILVIADALGSDLSFVEGKGPVIANPIQEEKDLKHLVAWTPDACEYVYEAIDCIQERLKPRSVPLIGFAGAPFTVAAYMIEGGSSKTLPVTHRLMREAPQVLHALMSHITAATTDYLRHQIRAGVDALQLFDTWAIRLSDDDYDTFNLPYIRDIITTLKSEYDCPLLHFSKDAQRFSDRIAALPVDGMSVDETVTLSELRTRYPNKVLQGNLLQSVLYESPEVIKRDVTQLLDSMAGDPGYIFNLAHGILPDFEQDKVKFLVDIIQNYSA